MPKITRGDLASSLAGAMIAPGWLVLAVALHDHALPEDLTTLWVCDLSGNGVCGPDQPSIQANPINFLHNWDLVIQYYLA